MTESWILLLYAFPKGKASRRVELWRQLRRFGCLALNTSAFVLPDRPSCHERLQWLAKRILDGGGEATVSKVLMIEGLGDEEIQARFNVQRNAEYADLLKQLSLLRRQKVRGSTFSKKLDRLKRLAQQINEIDYFEATKGKDVAKTLLQLEQVLAGEPTPHAILDPRQYRKRIWMTRPHPEVDRCASAWLIRRAIDPDAKFIFGDKRSKNRPVLTFDMLEGDFTHEGDRCTFETLCHHFGISDPRLLRIAEMIHDADLEDGKFGQPQAVGIDLMLKGLARMKHRSEAILNTGLTAMEALYQALKDHES